MTGDTEAVEYHVHEFIGGSWDDDGYLSSGSMGHIHVPRSIHSTREDAERAAEEYETWEYEAEMEVGDRVPHATIFEVQID